ncbi:hypothetical protein PsYK624_165840 [Phanerochaete sordida]|uniref:Uncharacterized protein n=1 Tax=Phanerochaete sordida TaxID=48140 RepID=A0A9P3LN76_9APHY|nr:hypothetical protein PsYK624_165840 [Phanerochaete sordida]
MQLDVTRQSRAAARALPTWNARRASNIKDARARLRVVLVPQHIRHPPRDIPQPVIHSVPLVCSLVTRSPALPGVAPRHALRDHKASRRVVVFDTGVDLRPLDCPARSLPGLLCAAKRTTAATPGVPERATKSNVPSSWRSSPRLRSLPGMPARPRRRKPAQRRFQRSNHAHWTVSDLHPTCSPESTPPPCFLKMHNHRPNPRTQLVY